MKNEIREQNALELIEVAEKKAIALIEIAEKKALVLMELAGKKEIDAAEKRHNHYNSMVLVNLGFVIIVLVIMIYEIIVKI